MAHAEIGHGNVHRKLCQCSNQFTTVCTFANDLKAGGSLQAISQRNDNKRMIVGQGNANGFCRHASNSFFQASGDIRRGNVV
ncbi:hypothetical protein [Cupriavidus pauculus]|uniref:hypothetical protein n=1 Tax=Cupriavidus pauculus TaxID=82633 RepID=UPI003898D6CA